MLTGGRRLKHKLMGFGKQKREFWGEMMWIGNLQEKMQLAKLGGVV